jgi:hypothetical protein
MDGDFFHFIVLKVLSAAPSHYLTLKPANQSGSLASDLLIAL